MKRTHLLLLPALLLSLGSTGVPVRDSELRAAANRALGAALAEVNSAYAVSRLYRATRGSVTKVIPAGLNTADLLVKFGVKETECAKSSRHDPQTCAFSPGFFVPSASCSARVRVTTTTTSASSPSSAQVVSLRCGGDSSSSSESSEEVFPRRRHQPLVPSTELAPPAPPTQTDRIQSADVQLRGDTFSNYLV